MEPGPPDRRLGGMAQRSRLRPLSTAIAGALLAAAAGALLAFAVTRPVLASCVSMEMQLKDLQPGTAVFVGTVADRDASGVRVRVDQWFAGADPRDVMTIAIAGRDQPVILGTWDPRPGEAWFIVGERIGPGTIESNVCRQVPLDVGVVTLATNLYGLPSLPPFAAPGGPEQEPSPDLPIGLGIGVIALGVLVGLGAAVALQRRPA